MKLEDLKKHVHDLCSEHLQAISSFHSWEELQLFRSTAVLDKPTAEQHVAAIKEYAGFLMAAEHALQTQTYISLAKLYVGNDQWGTGTYFGLAADQAKLDTKGLLQLVDSERVRRLSR
jgi:hypothetical protein